MLEPATPALSHDVARRMIPLIRRIAYDLVKRLPRHVRVEDLVGAGFQGLVAAHARFDPRRGDVFESYAEFRIRGAMLDELRASDPLSRDRRNLAKQTVAAARAVSARTGRAPLAEEVAAELGLTMKQYWERLDAVTAITAMSLDADDEHGGIELADTRAESPDDQLARKELAEAVNRAVAELPPRLAYVLELHFVDGLTLKEVGQRLHVSESRICQLVGDAVRRIRERCAEHAESNGNSAPPSRRVRRLREPTPLASRTRAAA